jgi:hypothetical protein
MKFRNPFKKKAIPRSEIKTDQSGHSVLRKTEEFKLYAIRPSDDDNELLGAVLLTDVQERALNEAMNPKGIKFTRK